MTRPFVRMTLLLSCLAPIAFGGCATVGNFMKNIDKGPKPDLTGVEAVRMPKTQDNAAENKKIADLFKKNKVDSIQLSVDDEWTSIRHPVTGLILGQVKFVYDLRHPSDKTDVPRHKQQAVRVDEKDPESKDVCVITVSCVAQEYIGNSFKDEITWPTSDMATVMKEKNYSCVADLGHYYEDKKSGGNLMLCSNANK